jgi:purine-nucleoside phosphorylase
MESQAEVLSEGARYVRSKSPAQPRIGVVLGSGLGAFAETLREAVRIPYREIAGMPVSTAIGHAGELVLGKLGAVDLAVMSGRFHLYEGYGAREVTAGVRLLHELGVRTLVLTCAAGGLDKKFGEGSLVLITDHINLQGANPLVGPNDDRLGPRFPDMTEVYSRELRKAALATAGELGIPLEQGIYAGLLGPSYETPAEIRFLKVIGADLVGMSTVPEAIAANHLGMKVLGIACVTNLAAGISPEKLQHDDVLAVGRRVAGTFLRLLNGLLPRLSPAT